MARSVKTLDLFATHAYVRFAELYMQCRDAAATETTAQDEAHQARVELVRYADSHAMQLDIPSSDFILAVKRYANMLDPVAKTKIDNTVRTRYVSRTD